MTVPLATLPEIYSYNGPGDYAFSFQITDDDDLLVQYRPDENNPYQYENWVKDDDYTVTINEDKTGFVTTVRPETSGALVLTRNMPITQPVDYENSTNIDLGIIETSLDRLTMIAQQIKAAIDDIAGWSS